MYPEMIRDEMFMLAIRILADDDPAMRCEYRSPQYDNGIGQSKWIPCRNKAAMWTDRGLRCEDHRRD